MDHGNDDNVTDERKKQRNGTIDGGCAGAISGGGGS